MIAKLNENDKITTDIRATMDSLKDASDNAKEITKFVQKFVTSFFYVLLPSDRITYERDIL